MRTSFQQGAENSGRRNSENQLLSYRACPNYVQEENCDILQFHPTRNVTQWSVPHLWMIGISYPLTIAKQINCGLFNLFSVDLLEKAKTLGFCFSLHGKTSILDKLFLECLYEICFHIFSERMLNTIILKIVRCLVDMNLC